MKATLIVSLLATASSVMAHGFVQEFKIGGKRYAGSLPFSDQYKNPVPDRITQPFFENGNSFIDDVTSANIACNKGSKPAKLVAPAPAGSEVTFFWTAWPESHKGPVITYLADCGGDCTTAIGSTLNWFKIDEAGLLPNGKWAAEELITNNNTYTLKLPSKIKNGQYLMRHEIIALHASFDPKGAQFYPSCSNIEITGATGENTPETVKFPGAYTAQDAGILINIYYPKVTNYVIPGPPVYTEDGTSSPQPETPVQSGEPVPAPTSSFPTLVPTNSEGVYPTGVPAGTEGAATILPIPTEAPVPAETEEEDDEELITTTIITTIQGQTLTLTASYTSSCSGDDDISPETAAPVSTEQPACASEKTVTVVQTVTAEYMVATVTETAEYMVATVTKTVTAEYMVATVSVSRSHTVTVTHTIEGVPTTTSMPVPAPIEEEPYPVSSSIAGVPAIPSGTDFQTIPFPSATVTAAPLDIPSSTATGTPEPTGTGAPLTGYENAITRRDCDDAYAKCKRSFDGCMKRAKRSGMQTRSCEKFKRDVCVEGLRGCDARIWGYTRN